VLADVGLLGMRTPASPLSYERCPTRAPRLPTIHSRRCTRTSCSSRRAEQSFVIADIPGLIEGAAEGAGLGHQFLRHLSRTGLLLHLVDCSPVDGSDPVKDVRAIAAELRKYDEGLYKKPRWVVLNKIDLIAPDERNALAAEFRRRLRTKAPVFAISAATGEGCRELTVEIARFLQRQREASGDRSATQVADAAPSSAEDLA